MHEPASEESIYSTGSPLFDSDFILKEPLSLTFWKFWSSSPGLDQLESSQKLGKKDYRSSAVSCLEHDQHNYLLKKRLLHDAEGRSKSIA
jgi:hypothetical protein